MVTFIGDFQCKVDEKGRVVLSAAFKKAMADETRFVVRKDLFEKCLVMYPYSYWEEELAQLRKKLNPYNREHKAFLRDFFKSTVEISLDANGRFLIPKRLGDLVGVDREVVLIGVDRYIELWAKEMYDNLEENSDILANQAQKFLGSIDFEIEE